MKKYCWCLGMIILLLFPISIVFGEQEFSKEFMTLVADDDQIIARTAHRIGEGDQYLDSGDKLYEVYRVEGRIARCKQVKHEENNPWFSKARALGRALFGGELFKAKANNSRTLGIYHTHTDESYYPTDGISSEKHSGGIVDVGAVLAKAFESQGLKAIHVKDSHDPHDAMSYDRSRRTATNLLGKNPAVLFDVHRDAVPREEYATEINGEGVTKVQMVVGRSNPNFEATNEFAKQIKAKVDEVYPGLIKGIFYGKGKYNQDLAPRVMLLEFGTNSNHRESAERSAELFAAATKDIVYSTSGKTGGFNGKIVLWIVVFLGLGVGLYFLFNKDRVG